jgi:hypothetical protein
MAEFIFDPSNLDQVSKSFENSDRFLNFLTRLDQVELRKVSKAILYNYTNRNWESLSKDCNYLKDLSSFLYFQTLSRVCEVLRGQLKLSSVNSKAVNKYIYEVLLHLEHLSTSIKDYLESCSSGRLEYRKEDFELFSYSSIRFKDLKIIKTIPPSMKSNSPLDL